MTFINVFWITRRHANNIRSKFSKRNNVWEECTDWTSHAIKLPASDEIHWCSAVRNVGRQCAMTVSSLSRYPVADWTRGSAIAEEPRDALRQLKHYGRFLTELLTISSANPEEPCEHTVSWNRVNCCTNVRRIACENVCYRWMTFKVIQGHCRCHHLIGHILFPISLPL